MPKMIDHAPVQTPFRSRLNVTHNVTWSLTSNDLTMILVRFDRLTKETACSEGRAPAHYREFLKRNLPLTARSSAPSLALIGSFVKFGENFEKGVGNTPYISEATSTRSQNHW